MDNDISTMSLSLYMKKTLLVRVAQTCSALINLYLRKGELQQIGVAFVLLFLVLSFVFKASLTLGLESFVQNLERKKTIRQEEPCMYVSIWSKIMESLIT